MPRPALAAARALQVIDLFVLHPAERFTLTEISRRTGINSASAHALLDVMVRTGYLQRHAPHKTYALGPALVAAGAVALDQLGGIRAAQEEVDRLSSELSLEVLVTTVAGDDILVVGKSTYSSAYGAVMSIGQRLPMAPPIGSVFLAWSSSTEVDRWLERAALPLTQDEREQQRQVLDVVRSRGYAVAFETVVRRRLGSDLARQVDDDHAVEDIAQRLTEMAHAPYHLTVIEPERTYDVGMVASPIFDANRAVVAAVTLSGFNPDVPGGDVSAVGDRLLGTARVITKRSGGRMPAELD